MNVGIFGIGAIGSVISVELSKNKDLKLSFFNRSDKDVIQLKTEDTLVNLPLKLSHPDDIGLTLDWLIICLKAHQFEPALSDLKKLIQPNTKVAVIRNGLRLKAPLLPFIAPDDILECIIDCPTQQIATGFYEQFTPAIITTHPSLQIDSFQKLFQHSKVSIFIASDFKTISWKKVCESSALGSILCLSGETCWIFEDPEIQTLYKKILHEAIQVAKADGAIIESDFQKEMLDKLATYPPHKGSSMLTDRLNGKPIELAAKNKIISEAGKHYNIDTPLNDLVCILLKNTNKR